MYRLAIYAFIFLTVAVPAYAGEFEEGKVAFDFQDYETALQKWRPLAENGNAQAQASIGTMYSRGTGVTKSASEALRWWKKAADNGDSKFQSELGYGYYFGDRIEGIKRDFAEAMKWFQKAKVQVASGSMLLEGMGIIKDVEKGKRLIEEGAKEDSFVKNGVECLSTNIIELTSPYVVLRNVAERGNVDAQAILGSLYAGSVCSDDASRARRLAFHWLKIASDNGDREALNKLNAIRESMTSDEIAMAEKFIGNTQKMISDYGTIGEHPCVKLKGYIEGLNHDLVMAENAYFKKNLSYPTEIASLGIAIPPGVNVAFSAGEKYNSSEISVDISSPNCSSNGVAQDYPVGSGFHDNALEIEKLNDLINSGKLESGDLSEKLYERGLLLARISKTDQALADFNRAIELSPDDSIGVYYSRALLLRRSKQLDRAMADFDKVIAMKPTNGKSYYHKAMVLKDKKEYEAEINNLNRVIDLVPMDCNCVFKEFEPIFSQYGGEKKAIENAQGIVARNPGNIPALDYLKGLYEKQGNVEKVLEVFGKIMEIDQNKGARHQERGEYYYSLKQKERAIRDFIEAERLQSWVDWSKLIVERYFESNQPEEAIQDLNLAIKLDPSNCTLYFTRSFVHCMLGQSSDAIKDISKAVELCYDISRNSAIIYAKTGNIDKAIAEFEKMKAGKGWEESDYYTLSNLYDLKGDNEHKESALQERLDHINTIYGKGVKKGAEYYRWMAEFYRHKRDVNAEKAVLDELMATGGDNYSTRGVNYFRLGDFKPSIDDLNKAIEMNPQFWQVYYYRGLDYLALGQFDKAEKDLTEFFMNTRKYANLFYDDFSSVAPLSNHTYPKLLLYIAQKRMGKSAEAELRANTNKMDLAFWPAPIVSMFLGKLKPDDVIAAAKDRRQQLAKIKMIEAYFYSGEYYLLKSNTDMALSMFQKAIDIDDNKMVYETIIAKEEVKRINGIAARK